MMLSVGLGLGLGGGVGVYDVMWNAVMMDGWDFAEGVETECDLAVFPMMEGWQFLAYSAGFYVLAFSVRFCMARRWWTCD